MQVVPPWTLPLEASGNTFMHATPEMAPRVLLSSQSVTCPPCEPKQPSHQTVMLSNHGDTPTLFHVNELSLQPHFRVTPMQGIIPAKSSQVVSESPTFMVGAMLG